MLCHYKPPQAELEFFSQDESGAMLCHYKPLHAELSTFAQDEENLKRAHNEVPTEDELNCCLARSPAELATFRAIDAEMDAVSNPMGQPCFNL